MRRPRAICEEISVPVEVREPCRCSACRRGFAASLCPTEQHLTCTARSRACGSQRQHWHNALKMPQHTLNASAEYVSLQSSKALRWSIGIQSDVPLEQPASPFPTAHHNLIRDEEPGTEKSSSQMYIERQYRVETGTMMDRLRRRRPVRG